MEASDLEKDHIKKKAVMPVHYAGQPADMDAINKIAAKHGLFVLEDAAEAHGAVYKNKKVGGLGNAAMFSFTPTKNITTGEGGMITTDNDALAKTLRLLKSHGQEGQYNHVCLGYNYRITEMQSAIGVEQLRKIDGIISRKRKNAAIFERLLSDIEGIVPPFVPEECGPVFMMYTIKVVKGEFGHSRDELMSWLGKNGIQSKIYFPPVHRQPVFRDHTTVDLPVTEAVAGQLLSLPFHSKISEDDMRFMAEKITEIRNAKG